MRQRSRKRLSRRPCTVVLTWLLGTSTWTKSTAKKNSRSCWFCVSKESLGSTSRTSRGSLRTCVRTCFYAYVRGLGLGLPLPAPQPVALRTGSALLPTHHQDPLRAHPSQLQSPLGPQAAHPLQSRRADDPAQSPAQGRRDRAKAPQRHLFPTRRAGGNEQLYPSHETGNRL